MEAAISPDEIHFPPDLIGTYGGFHFIKDIRAEFQNRIRRCMLPLLQNAKFIHEESASTLDARMQMVSDLESEWALLQTGGRAVRLGMAILVGPQQWPQDFFLLTFEDWLGEIETANDKLTRLVLQGLKPWILEQQALSLAVLEAGELQDEDRANEAANIAADQLALLPAHPHIAAASPHIVDEVTLRVARDLHFHDLQDHELKGFFSVSKLAERLLRTADFAVTAASQAYLAHEKKMDRRKLAFLYVFGEAGAWGNIIHRTEQDEDHTPYRAGGGPEAGVRKAAQGTGISELMQRGIVLREGLASSPFALEPLATDVACVPGSQARKTEVAKRLVRACDPLGPGQGLHQLALYLRPVASVVAGDASFDLDTGCISITGSTTDAVAAPVSQHLERVCTVCALRARIMSDPTYRESLLPAVMDIFPAVLQIWLGSGGSLFNTLNEDFKTIVSELQRLGRKGLKMKEGIEELEKESPAMDVSTTMNAWEELLEHSAGFPWL